MKKILSNVIYQASYQILLILLPIVTIPIVSRALGPEGIGFYNYVNSIVAYFVLFAGLGLANYGIREIAYVKEDKKLLSKKFWELEVFNILIVLVIIFLYVVFLTFVDSKIYFLVSGFLIIATLFDISWFFAGIEEFKAITFGNLVIKIISFIAIVVCVHESDDLLAYFVIQTASVVFSNAILWIFLAKKICFIRISLKEAMRHFIPAFNYLIGKMAITLYTTLNKTLLGFLTTSTLVGLYTNSMQLNSIIVTLIASIDAVLLPHMTKLISKERESEMIRLMEKTINIQLYISIAAFFGLLTIFDKFVPWFFGSKFLFLNKTIPVLSILIVIIPLGTSIMRQYLMPKNQVRDFNKSVIFGAVIGLFLNLLLIPIIGIWGAIIATLSSEFFVSLIRVLKLLKETDFRFQIKSITKYTISGILMLVITRLITRGASPHVTTTILQVALGGSIYLMVTTLLNDSPVLKIINSLIGRKI